MKLSTDPQSVAVCERRHRISDRFKILQSLVPGGSKMDTITMLEEAIHYDKFLKTQIWLYQTMINLVGDSHNHPNYYPNHEIVECNDPLVDQNILINNNNNNNNNNLMEYQLQMPFNKLGFCFQLEINLEEKKLIFLVMLLCIIRCLSLLCCLKFN
ncbi:hypothetical protein FXO37_21678 [Capsicum annuum]|nr:hypothetical protein FXO37_21678 [Capsicum annuum]